MERRRYMMMRPEQERALSPFTTLRRMMEDFDDGQLSRWHPQVELFQRGDKLVVRADLPGLESKDVTVEVEDDTITIKGERRTEREETVEGFFHSERSYGSFERRIPLPPGIDRSAIDAFFQNGVLEVTIKLQQPSKQTVQIRGSEKSPSTTQENKTPQQSSQTNPQTPVQSNREQPPPPSRHN